MRPAHTVARFLCIVCVLPLLPAVYAVSAEPEQQEAERRLRFSVVEGRIHNEFLREGPVAAHVVLSSGEAPRLVVAFPAGNSGTALWFDARQPATWKPDVSIDAVQREADGGVLRGVAVEVGLTGSPVAVRHAILSSVRVIRDYGYTGRTPSEVLTAPQRSERQVVWQRRRLDGAPGYYLSLETLEGTIRETGDDRVELHPDEEERLRLKVTALTGDRPLVPIPGSRLLTKAARSDSRLRNALEFLSYEGKLLAGSWRFNTYFGRDTLMSVKLLMPVLEPDVVEAGLGSVLDRLNDAGEVAHEEDIGEYAVLRRVGRGEAPSDAPIYDYKMIDDDFLLPIVAADYLLSTAAGRSRAAAFLARATPAGESYGDALYRNCRFVTDAALPFAHDPHWRNLVSLKPGEKVGNWRDSEAGLGGGLYPYDVNGVLVPAALAAIARLHDSGLLPMPAGETTSMSTAEEMAEVWRQAAPASFEVSVEPGRARAQVKSYAERIGVDAAPALNALTDAPVVFRAVALDDRGAPIPVLNSDEGFTLLFLKPSAAEMQRILTTLMRPFPAGLMTDAGPVVANPAYADDGLEPTFDRTRYHGTVIWAWQQAVIAAGIARQYQRGDLNAAARSALERAQVRLSAALEFSHAVRGSELWSWSQDESGYRIEPFGQRSGDETESNAAQLWSTIRLAPLPALSRPGGSPEE